ncbi:MAG: HAMP domain-containing sensor histidine kinase [Bryobacteraceae bacterium]
MKSISARILIWSLSTLLLSLLAFSLISRFVVGRAVNQVFERIKELQLYQAREAYEHGGAPELARYLDQWHAFLKADHYLTDSSGKDLVTGQNRSALFAGMATRGQSQSRVGDRFVLNAVSADGRYHFLAIIRPPFSLATFVPYYLMLLACVVVLFWLLAVDIASPIRSLTRTVRCFGAGNLTARVDSRRKDEIGELSRTFNEMAERIGTLLTAERQLLEDVSHELRSPLVRLSFAAELVRKAPDRDAAVSRLRREIDRLSELVSTLLEMTRAEGNPRSGLADEVQLSDLLQEIVDDCAVEADARGCSTQMTADDDTWITGDRELLRRAIENIIRNAVRYAPEGSVVEVRMRRNDAGPVISIRDYGPGVPEDLLPRIFDPFVRADPSRSEATGGFGLGLAIARRAVLLHRGQISVRNGNPGLIVTVTLPRGERPADLGADANPTAADSGPQQR